MTCTPAWPASRYAERGLQPSPNHPANPRGPQDVASLLIEPLAQSPDAQALVDRRGRMTYAQLDAAINAAATAMLTWGIVPGDRVAASGANHNHLVIAFLATQRIGAIWVGINRAYAPPEKRHLIEDCQAKLFLCDAPVAPGALDWVGTIPNLLRIVVMDPSDTESAFATALARHAGVARPVIEIDRWAPAAIAYTSGTTGFPKGVVHSQHNMVVTASVSVEHSNDARPETVRGTALPLTILNLMILGPVAALGTGARHVNLDRIDALGVAEWICAERIANISLVPTIVHDLLTRPDISAQMIDSLSWLVVGGSVVPPELPDLYRRRFGRRMTIGYGLTEGPNGVAKTHDGSPDVSGVIGRPLPHLELAILDARGREQPPGGVGEIAFRASGHGPWANIYTPALGYWGNAQATQALLRDGWVHSGDYGLKDDRGEFHIRDRGTDLILRGGANIYPAEIERVLRMDRRVRDCAVLGRPDPRLGQRVAAFVEPVDPGIADNALIDDLKALCGDNLAAYKAPTEWSVVANLPRNAMGKIVRKELAARWDQ